MVDASIVGLLVGLATLLALGGYYEWRSQPNVPLVVRISFMAGLSVQLVDSIVIDGTWGLVTISTPDWVGLSTTTMSGSFLVFPGYAVWRWLPRSPDALDTDAKRRLYRSRWYWFGLAVVVIVAFALVFCLVLMQAGIL
ncbi:hypothetical protein [Halococcus hamelinensis]|uniref:Uncharacterized protein n=1 Tax=Halococcus hamelinensis 100A6 TaxID=1132509 RepID=M0MB11_9EURY|nr:hypothetical protein [Halococcus hamelinensis]EMA41575.1 hypothetical protein C447_01935 [Halococcus hamelinensis 100A6]